VATADADLDVAVTLHEILFSADWHDRARRRLRSSTAAYRRPRRCARARPTSARRSSRGWRSSQ